MCGRASLTASGEEIAEAFDLEEAPEVAPRYNIAPGQDLLIVRASSRRKEARNVRWGLPRSGEEGGMLINARSESAPRAPAFRDAFRGRRCLVPVSGFYEWRRTGGLRQPWFIRRRDGRPFGLGALWERVPGDEDAPERAVILTTAPNELVARLHDRMPVVVPPEAYGAWLGLAPGTDPAALLGPAPAEAFESFPVSERVNRVEVDDPELIRPLPAERQGTLF
jgi:putative SOS response-associated peptidase YedK